jgi:phosphonate transport system substrate-binding protein
VLLKTTHDFNSFWDRMATQQYDLVHYNQYHYVRSHRDFGYQVILKNEEFKRSTIASTLVVRDDSGIHSVADLKGKKIVFGGNQMAMVSYIGTRYLLQQGGLQSNGYLTSFAINPIKAVVAVYYRQAAGAGTGDTGLELAKNLHQVDTSKLRVLAESEPLAHLPWAVKGSLDPQITNQLQSALSTLQESRRGRKILHNAALTRLVVATDDEYDAHRRIIAAVLGETY